MSSTKTLLLPRAALDLNSDLFPRLSVKPSTVEFYRNCFQESLLEKNLQEYSVEHALNFTSMISTDLLPTQLAYDISEQLKNKTPPDIIIFVSKHAAVLAKTILPVAWFDHAQLFSVGKSSKVIFQHENLLIHHAKRENGESLMDLPAMHDIKNKSVLICKGQQGLNDIENQCRSRGANVQVLDLYQRVSSHAKLPITIDRIDSVYGVSGFVLKHFLDALSESDLSLILQKPLYTMSERIEKIAKGLGFQDIRSDIV